MRFATLLAPVLALAMAVAAVPTNGGTNNQCHGGDTYCCNDAPVLHNPTGGLAAVPISVLASLSCSPLTIIGVVLGTTCSKSTVCCQNVGTNGLVNVQCLALTL
ncbi:hypothetical protein BKA62DRAFT_668551 [Auriculariales sp. MPI-PUGE-AT-0066]|nr:hypothetical protein BKA62DRAFT_668551 [Auriculariales sp. MPI-PUGE-AT-0066]